MRHHDLGGLTILVEAAAISFSVLFCFFFLTACIIDCGIPRGVC